MVGAEAYDQPNLPDSEWPVMEAVITRKLSAFPTNTVAPCVKALTVQSSIYGEQSGDNHGLAAKLSLCLSCAYLSLHHEVCRTFERRGIVSIAYGAERMSQVIRCTCVLVVAELAPPPLSRKMWTVSVPSG